MDFQDLLTLAKAGFTADQIQKIGEAVTTTRRYEPDAQQVPPVSQVPTMPQTPQMPQMSQMPQMQQMWQMPQMQEMYGVIPPQTQQMSSYIPIRDDVQPPQNVAQDALAQIINPPSELKMNGTDVDNFLKGGK